MLDTGFFVATARVRGGFRHGAYIATEQDRSFAAYAMAEGAWRHQGAFRFLAVAPTGKRYFGIVPELA